MNVDKNPWYVALLLTIMMSIATTIGTLMSSYILLPMELEEQAAKAMIERKSKGAQLHCEKLQLSASLASEIRFISDRGYSSQASNEKLQDEQRTLEKRAAELIPFLTPEETKILERLTLHHHVVTSLRTSNVPLHKRILPSEGGFDANEELRGIRNGASKLASLYRANCTESL